MVQVLKFLALLILGQGTSVCSSRVLALVIFTFTGFILVFFSLAVFLLPLIPIRLAYPDFRAHRLQAGVEVLLSVAAVVLALMLPTPEGSWSSPLIHAGGAAAAGLIIAFWARGIPRRSARLRLNDGAIL